MDHYTGLHFDLGHVVTLEIIILWAPLTSLLMTNNNIFELVLIGAQGTLEVFFLFLGTLASPVMTNHSTFELQTPTQNSFFWGKKYI
jgi:hypothetical protein